MHESLVFDHAISAYLQEEDATGLMAIADPDSGNMDSSNLAMYRDVLLYINQNTAELRFIEP